MMISKVRAKQQYKILILICGIWVVYAYMVTLIYMYIMSTFKWVYM